MPCIDDLLRAARRHLEPGEAEILLAHAAGRDRTWLYAHGGDEAATALVDTFDGLVARRRAGEPVAYLTGRRGFWSLDLAVTPATLVPRPETERLVELVLERLPDDRVTRVLDLGTGSGAVALAIARERPRACVVATDASATALEVAHANARNHDLANVEFRIGHWFDAVPPGLFDVIVSNPPYIAEADPHLGLGDLRFEPPAALASGPDGLDAIREIVAGAPSRLVPRGWLLLEHGLDQGDAVRGLMAGAGLESVTTATDLEHRDRVSLGQQPG